MARIATIGFFDGVHRGHRYLFECLAREASARGMEMLVVTFDRHPREVLHSDFVPRLLTTLDERVEMLRRTVGRWSVPAEVLVLPFAEICALTAEEFLCLLHERYQVETLLMGYDHRFGSDRLRHPADYRHAGQQAGVEVLTNDEFSDGEWRVSSTEIRGALEQGNIALANDLLGRPYALTGTVVHGNSIGRTIGFPTANLQPADAHKIVPKSGVYTCSLLMEDGAVNKAVVNIGTNPTIGNAERTIEVHIPHFEGDLYGQRLTVLFERYLREEKRFADLEQLKKQIAEDISNL